MEQLIYDSLWEGEVVDIVRAHCDWVGSYELSHGSTYLQFVFTSAIYIRRDFLLHITTVARTCSVECANGVCTLIVWFC